MVIDDENFHVGELHVSSPRTSVLAREIPSTTRGAPEKAPCDALARASGDA
jgi:hypothetical protein